MQSFRGNNHADTRERNRRMVLRAILRRGPLSRPDLCALSRLAPATITYIVNQLIADGLLLEVSAKAPRPGTRGPRQMLLDLNPRGVAVLAITLGIYSRSIALVGPRGQILAEATQESDAPNPTLGLSLERTVAVARSLLADSGIPKATVVGIGVAAEGLVDSTIGMRTFVPYRNWSDVPVARDLEEHLGIPTVVANIAHALAMAEVWFGQGQHVESLLLVNIATTINSAAVVRHEVLQGHRNAAGAIGHVTVRPDGMPCICGKRGCLETVASERAIAAAASEAARSGRSPRLLELSAGSEGLTVFQVAEAARDGEEVAAGIVEEAAVALGTVLASVVTMLQPEAIVVEGNVATIAGEVFLGPLRRTIAAQAMLGRNGMPPVLVTNQGRQLGLVGAAALALDRFFYLPQLASVGKEEEQTTGG